MYILALAGNPVAPGSTLIHAEKRYSFPGSTVVFGVAVIPAPCPGVYWSRMAQLLRCAFVGSFTRVTFPPSVQLSAAHTPAGFSKPPLPLAIRLGKGKEPGSGPVMSVQVMFDHVVLRLLLLKTPPLHDSGWFHPELD